MSIEAFIITNGRGTFDYAYKSLENQSYPDLKITIIRDKKWIDAVNKCLKLSESKYFIRVDDDMFLHAGCVQYMYEKISERKPQKRVAAYACKLWEDWTSKVAGSIKVYHTDVVRKMGGFRANKMGKIDKPFTATVNKKRLIMVKDNSIVGIHAIGTWEEQKRYRNLWLKNNSRVFYKRPRSYMVAQKTYNKSPEEQFELVKMLSKKNRRKRTGFGSFLKRNRIDQKDFL